MLLFIFNYIFFDIFLIDAIKFFKHKKKINFNLNIFDYIFI